MTIEDIMIDDYGVLREDITDISYEVRLDLNRLGKLNKIRTKIISNNKWLKRWTHAVALHRIEKRAHKIIKRSGTKLSILITKSIRLKMLISDLREYYGNQIEEKLSEYGIETGMGLAAVFTLESKHDTEDIDKKLF